MIVSVYTCGFFCAFEHVVIKNRSISQKHLSLVALILSDLSADSSFVKIETEYLVSGG